MGRQTPKDLETLLAIINRSSDALRRRLLNEPGQLITFNGDEPVGFTPGPNGYSLVADSEADSGLSWVDVTGTGGLVTSVTAGDGLQGGGQGDITLAVDGTVVRTADLADYITEIEFDAHLVPNAHHDPATVAGLGLSLNGQEVTLVSSSNPGEAPAIMATDENGGVTLAQLGVGAITSHLLPDATDTRDLGSSSRLWRKGWLSEMEAILFVENTATAIGGWFLIPHGQGTLGEDVNTSETQIQFDQTMTPGDFVLLRGIGQVEYMEIGSLVSGTIYNVTRDLDGSGANNWPQGHVFIVLGATGNGRIELDAQTGGPRISVIEQGAAYNAQAERVRLGDMAGWKAGASGYGFGFGDPSGNHVIYTPSDGLVIVGNGGQLTSINGGNIITGSIEVDKLDVATLSAITADLGTVTAGTITGVTINFGNGAGIMDTDGITMLWGEDTDYESQVKWKNSGGSYVARIAALETGSMLIRSENLITLQTPTETFMLNNGKVISTVNFEGYGTGRFYGNLYISTADTFLTRGGSDLLWWDGSAYHHVTGYPGWSSFSYLNSWTNYGSTFSSGGYFKDGHGVVHLRGLIKNGTNAHIATLPAGYRPAGNEIFPAITWNSVFCRITIYSDGRIEATSYSSTWLSLAGITFKAS